MSANSGRRIALAREGLRNSSGTTSVTKLDSPRGSAHTLRRTSNHDASRGRGRELRLDLEKRLVTMHGRPVSLTPIEYDLLRLFAENEGKLLTHPTILREIWGPAYGEESNYLHVYVSHLRRKIEPDPARPRYILNQPGVGYRMVDSTQHS